MTDNNTCISLAFQFKTETPVRLPQFLGSALRGVLGKQLLRQHCFKKEIDCKNCEKPCMFSSFFLRIDYDHNTDNTLPNKYVFYHNGTTDMTDTIHFTFKLIGDAAAYKNDVLAALQEGCAHGLGVNRIPFYLERMTEERIPILTATEKADMRDDDFSDNQITLHFDTPLQIKTHQRGVVWSLDFELLMRNILRRLGSLEIANIAETEQDELLGYAKEINVWQSSLKPHRMTRYSNHTKEKRSLSGLVGDITFSGDLKRFLPYLRAGEIIHVGKACTMGLGHYGMG